MPFTTKSWIKFRVVGDNVLHSDGFTHLTSRDIAVDSQPSRKSGESYVHWGGDSRVFAPSELELSNLHGPSVGCETLQDEPDALVFAAKRYNGLMVTGIAVLFFKAVEPGKIAPDLIESFLFRHPVRNVEPYNERTSD